MDFIGDTIIRLSSLIEVHKKTFNSSLLVILVDSNIIILFSDSNDTSKTIGIKK